MIVYLVPNTTKPLALSVTKQAIKLLQQAGANAILDCSVQDFCKASGIQYLSAEDAFCECDAVITIGGDGTLLHTAKQCLKFNKPILGINLGRTGFLATCEIDEMEYKLSKLAHKEFQYDNRSLLTAIVNENFTAAKTALNDVVIYKGSRLQTIDFNIYCDEILVNRCSGDGVIIATPTGSTAYSLSAGGPILDTHIQGIVVSMICAHSLNQPAMVFAADRKIRIEVNSNQRNDIFISTDGDEEQRLSDGASVQIELLKQSINLITFNPADQFDAIDKKLRGR